jgi:flagella basal body P-ring formation protein FlgA
MPTLKINIILIISIFILATTNSVELKAQSTFSADRLTDACLNYIYSEVGGDAEVTISKKIETQEFTETGVSARFEAAKGSLRGNCFVAVEFYLDSKLIRRIEVPVRVRIFAIVAVAAESLFRGSEINENQIIFEKKDITNYKPDELFIKNDFSGKKVKRNISKGAIITRSHIEEAAVIRRGAKVDIIVESGSVHIRASGESLQDAAPGDTVRVRREGTSTILQGIASSDGSVVISNKAGK